MALQKYKVAAIQVRGYTVGSHSCTQWAQTASAVMSWGVRIKGTINKKQKLNNNPWHSISSSTLLCFSCFAWLPRRSCSSHCGSSHDLHAEQVQCLLLPCSLLPTLGIIEEQAGQSCKDIRDAMSNDCQLVPPSGSYYINTADTCTGNKKTLKVYKGCHAPWL